MAWQRLGRGERLGSGLAEARERLGLAEARERLGRG